MTVVIGIDPHKASHTAAAVGADLAEVGAITVRATRSTPQELLRWAEAWPQRRWAIEGARGLGQLLAQQLVTAGEHVVDVPSTLSTRVRALETGHGRKTDRADARAVAVVAARRPDLARVDPQMTTTRCSGCFRTAAASSPANGAGPSTGCTATCAT